MINLQMINQVMLRYRPTYKTVITQLSNQLHKAPLLEDPMLIYNRLRMNTLVSGPLMSKEERLRSEDISPVTDQMV